MNPVQEPSHAENKHRTCGADRQVPSLQASKPSVHPLPRPSPDDHTGREKTHSYSFQLFNGILDLSNLPSSWITIFFPFSPTTNLVLPQLKSSIFQNEYRGKKKEKTGMARM